jgi:hypothetical protein
MEFSFEVNPDLDIAIGTEVSYEEEQESEYVLEEEFDFADVDPLNPTGAKPGSEDKVRMLAARYAAGVPLWHDEDCNDHGPSDALLNFPAANSTSSYELDDDF